MCSLTNPCESGNSLLTRRSTERLKDDTVTLGYKSLMPGFSLSMPGYVSETSRAGS